jgi:hypothetical protein
VVVQDSDCAGLRGFYGSGGLYAPGAILTSQEQQPPIREQCCGLSIAGRRSSCGIARSLGKRKSRVLCCGQGYSRRASVEDKKENPYCIQDMSGTFLVHVVSVLMDW